MAVPDFQTLMLPLLKSLDDGAVHPYHEIVAGLATTLGLSDEDRQFVYEKTGNQVFESRVGWAGTHLKSAGMLKRPSRGAMQITPEGQSLLASAPQSISMKLLKERSLSYRDYYAGKPKEAKPGSDTTDDDDIEASTPEELIEQGYSLLAASLKAQLKDYLATIDPFQFERLVIRLLKQMGYGGSESDMHKALAMRGDEGIDGWIKEDQLGLNMLYVQAKRHKANIQRPDLQRFVGALEERHSAKGIFITISGYSDGVEDYIKKIRHQVVLIDGNLLVKLMFDHNVGVLPTGQAFVMKVLDPSVFVAEQSA